jgi:hypothetical protein
MSEIVATRDSTGRRVDVDAAHPLHSTLYGADGTQLTIRVPADGQSLTAGVVVNSLTRLYNGTTLEIARGNLEGTLLASAARTAATFSANQTNYNHRGVLVWVTVTVAGTGSLDPRIQGLEPVSGSAYALNNTPTAITTTGTKLLMLYPMGTASNNNATQAISSALPRTWRVSINPSDSSSWTYSVGYSLIL